MINEKRKQYVDPLVNKGITTVQNSFNKSTKKKNLDLEEQTVLYEKLKKIKKFLDNMKGGSSYEKDNRTLLNVDVDEENFLDIKLEVDTMIQMVYMKPNYH